MEKEELVLQQDVQGQVLTKWLRVLLFAEIASLVTLFSAMVPVLDGIGPWIGRGASVAVLAALYQLCLVHKRYWKAFKFYLIAFIGTLVQAFAGSNIFTTAASICGLVATYQEYSAHGELLNVIDNQLSGKWMSLFYWELAAGAVGAFVAMAVVMVGVGYGMEETLVVILGVAAVAVLEVPLSLLRLRYLKRTITCFQE